MTINLPLLDQTFETLHREMAVIPYVLLVAALIRQVHVSDGSPVKMMQVLGKLILVCVVIYNARVLYTATEHFFLTIAGKISSEYLKYPLGLASEILDNTQQEKMGFWDTITGGGVYESIWLGLMSFMVNMLSYIQVPFLVIQYFIVKAGFLVFPFIMTLFMYPALCGIAFRYVTHILSVMAWPVGFAMANLIAFQILNQFNESGINTASLIGNKAGTASGNIAASVTAGLIMLFGMITTPKMMTGLFSSGVGLASAGGEFLRTISTSKMALGMAARGALSAGRVSKGAYSTGKNAYSKFRGNAGSTSGAGNKWDFGGARGSTTGNMAGKIRTHKSDI